MNAKQKALAIESIENDCDGRYDFYNLSTGKTCAVGGLAISAGIDHSWTKMSDYLGKIAKFYGLSKDLLWDITAINDDYKTKQARRNNVIKFINTLEVTDGEVEK